MKERKALLSNKSYWEMMVRLDWKAYLGSCENAAYFEDKLRDLDAQIEKLEASRKK